ncbi:hypothetical protein KKC1_28480 [Calderihabitans maritimus]|uniref:Uncharacterized protein n=2 Tax=Calderihabitans maritimus TaxID=1246530 RepID=A0A1Z5HWQ8_9FIRM|nr:hypothetical protein KKC1_28480 [Calderihabitans maritimus]
MMGYGWNFGFGLGVIGLLMWLLIPVWLIVSLYFLHRIAQAEEKVARTLEQLLVFKTRQE